MLLSFVFENFKSFREEQSFSLIAKKAYKESLETNTASTNRNDVPHVLRTAAIYGSNAAGKSNLIRAIRTVQDMVVHNQIVDRRCGFLFDKQAKEEPTSFEVTLLIDDDIYVYAFSVTSEWIEEEKLTYHPNKKFARGTVLFSRMRGDDGQYEWKFSPQLKGLKKNWSELTRPDSLFLSTAVQFNAIQLKPIFEWFKNQLVIIDDRAEWNQIFTLEQIYSNNPNKEKIINLVKSADFGITDIKVKKENKSGPEFYFDPIRQVVEKRDNRFAEYSVEMIHKIDDDEWSLGGDSESLGTRKFFHLAGPIIDMLDKKITLVVDELDSSLHPILLKKIVELFNSAGNQSRQSQLIFTTHCDYLLENDTQDSENPLLRRDQVWLVNKSYKAESSLYSVADFDLQKNESIRNAYIKGFMKAVPYIENLKV